MPSRIIVVATYLAIVAPTGAHAECHGFFNQSEQGYKFEGDRLEPSGPVAAAGTEFEFNGMSQIKDRFYLTRSRSDIIFDAQNVELTGGCDLPNRRPPQAR